LDRERVIRFLKPGRTRDEIVAEFGPPTVEELNVKGEILMTWVALQDGVPFFKRRENQALGIRLDEHGMMLDYSITGTLEPEKPKESVNPVNSREANQP
jgi:hypothetical protein